MRKYLILMAAAAAIFASCGRPAKKAETPSAREFAPYIKAYTGGMVPRDAELRIDLMQEVQGVAPAGLFSANPGIKGTVRWNSPSSVSFLPEAGALEPGQTYNINFHLEKLWADVPSFIYPIVVKGSSESGAILVPDNGRPFRVKQLTLKDGRIDVVLSRNPANAALQGMVELEGAARSYTEVQDSLLRVYYEGRSEDLVGIIFRECKNIHEHNEQHRDDDTYRMRRFRHEHYADIQDKYPYISGNIQISERLIIRSDPCCGEKFAGCYLRQGKTGKKQYESADHARKKSSGDQHYSADQSRFKHFLPSVSFRVTVSAVS